MGKIFTENPRVLNSDVAGARPSRDPKNRLAFLKPGGIFINSKDGVLCMGIEGGGWIEFQITRIKTVV